MGKKKKKDPNLNRERSKQRLTKLSTSKDAPAGRPYSLQEVENMGIEGLMALDASKATLSPDAAAYLERKLLEYEITGKNSK